jgi:LPS export ABC transporter protein LptC
MNPRAPATTTSPRVLLALACAAPLALAPACSTREAPEPPAGQVMEQPEQVSSGFRLTRSEKGRKEWELEAAKAEIFQAGDLVELVGIEIVFFDSTGAEEGTLSGASGRAKEREQVMEIEGGAFLRTSKGSTLRTDHLTWDHRGGLITTDAYVEIERGADRLTGYGLVATPDLTRAEVQRDVTIRGRRD